MCPFSSLHPLGKGKGNEKNKRFKISKKGNKKKCHLVPKVVTDLPFEGRKVEGSRKYIRREKQSLQDRLEIQSHIDTESE